jgi:Domain of Unknown Function (DUF1080)
MKKYFSFLLMATLFVSCQQKKNDTQTDVDSIALSSTAIASDAPVLTEQQKAEGWKLLFDGKTMDGWKTFKGKENNTWEVIDGTLHCKPFIDGQTEKRADIMTIDQYENFELMFDWKISAQGNSGVIYRASEEFDEPYASGPEYQVIDDEGYPGDLTTLQFSGACYGMYAPSAKTVKSVGEWNESKLIVNNNHVEHWLNGTKVVGYEFQSADWKKLVASGKWKDFPNYGLTKKGHIDLQDHSNEVWFKNILIKVI